MRALNHAQERTLAMVWFPRGTRLDNIEPDHADAVADLINNQQRRSLGYQSPASLFAAASAH